MIPHHEQITLRKAVKVYGLEVQRDLLIGKMAQLTGAVLQERHDVPSDVIGALADVSIMVDQMLLAYGEVAVGTVRDEKIEQLLGAIEGA